METDEKKTLKDRLLSQVEEMETVLRQLGESVCLSRERRTYGEEEGGIKQSVQLLVWKERQFQETLRESSEFAARKNLIERLEQELRLRNEYIGKIETCFKDAENALISAVFQANQKLKMINQANHRKVAPDDLIRYAHRISKTNSVAAPLTWQQGDPERPFPTDADMRQGWLARKHEEDILPPPPLPGGEASVMNFGTTKSPHLANALRGAMAASPRMMQRQSSPSMFHEQMMQRPFPFTAGPVVGPRGSTPPMMAPGQMGRRPPNPPPYAMPVPKSPGAFPAPRAPHRPVSTPWMGSNPGVRQGIPASPTGILAPNRPFPIPPQPTTPYVGGPAMIRPRRPPAPTTQTAPITAPTTGVETLSSDSSSSSSSDNNSPA